jgi:predicted dehydrogenase
MPFPAFPPSVAVVGGGRWARVLLEVLGGLLPPEVALSAHSASNSQGVARWAEEKGWAGRLAARAEPPKGAAAVLVANLACDHEAAAVAALRDGAAVLLEKPLAPDAAGAERILAASGGKLAASQVFRYARFVDGFARRCAQAGPLESLSVIWTSPAVESRYGEVVRHDAGLAFAADVLPHVCALVEAVAGHPPSSLRSAAREDAVERLMLDAGGLPVDARLQRGGDVRRRILEARAGGLLITLDFSTEPGTIAGPEGAEAGDPDWKTKPRPLASMLSAFLGWTAGGKKDSRLEPDTALLACRLADEAARRLG